MPKTKSAPKSKADAKTATPIVSTDPKVRASDQVTKPPERGKPGDLEADLEWRAYHGDLYARRLLVEHGKAEPTEHEAGQGIVAREK